MRELIVCDCFDQQDGRLLRASPDDEFVERATRRQSALEGNLRLG